MNYYTNKNLPGIKGQVSYYNDRLEHTIIETVPPVVAQLYYNRTFLYGGDIKVTSGHNLGYDGKVIANIDGTAKSRNDVLFDYNLTDKQLQILSRPTFDTGSGKQYNDLTSVINLRGSHDHRSMRKLQDLGLVTVHNDAIYATVKGRLAGIGLNLSLTPMQNLLRFDGSSYLMEKEQANATNAQMSIKSFLYTVELYDDKGAFNADYDQLNAISKDQPNLDDVLKIRDDREQDLRIKLSKSELAKSDAHHKNYRLSNRISEFVNMLKGHDEEDHHLIVTWDTKAGKSWLNLGPFEEQFIRINEDMHGSTKIDTYNHLAN